MLIRTFDLDPATDSDELTADIDRALVFVNESLGLDFSHDGAEVDGDVRYTVWTDDVDGDTETSWIRLLEARGAGTLLFEVNAHTQAELDALSSAFLAQLSRWIR